MPLLTIEFSDHTADELSKLAKKQGKSETKVIEDGLGFLKWAMDVRAQGYKILVEHEGEAQEVLSF
jgi:predicted transcriptional regulator